MAIPHLQAVESAAAWQDAAWDAVVLVTSRFELASIDGLGPVVQRIRDVDGGLGGGVSLHRVEAAAGSRLVISPAGPLERDEDDVRRIGDAAKRGLRRARDAGARRPLLLVESLPRPIPGFERAGEVAVLEGLAGLWAPLEAREAKGESEVEPVEQVGFVGTSEQAVHLSALEHARRISRDLGGTEPERMAPPRFADYIADAFRGSDVSVEVKEDVDTLDQAYPLLSSVARASIPVQRHRPRVIRMGWRSEGPIAHSLFLAGKAVTYDTGGADLKTGGVMAGMSRDKGGGASVAGLFWALSQLKPKGWQVVAEIGAVRNSIGAESFVSDEIITGHSGVRVRIGNTDAEGRLVLADLLSHMREEAVSAPGPILMSVATLTGHSARAVGPYSIALDNGPARDAGWGQRLFQSGERWADPFELSTLRREDFAMVEPRSPADDVLSSNNAASTATPRGHQFPMAFLAVASGLDRHGRTGNPPLPFTHIDIGGSFAEGGDWQHGNPTGAPVLALIGALRQ